MCELAMERRRLWWWERRQTLLLATLAHAFLLSLLPLLSPAQTALRCWLLQCWCRRAGKRSRDTSALLYRLRSALGGFWLIYFLGAHPIHASSG
jgi:hypothetical protein